MSHSFLNSGALIVIMCLGSLSGGEEEPEQDGEGGGRGGGGEED